MFVPMVCFTTIYFVSVSDLFQGMKYDFLLLSSGGHALLRDCGYNAVCMIFGEHAPLCCSLSVWALLEFLGRAAERRSQSVGSRCVKSDCEGVRRFAF